MQDTNFAAKPLLQIICITIFVSILGSIISFDILYAIISFIGGFFVIMARLKIFTVLAIFVYQSVKIRTLLNDD